MTPEDRLAQLRRDTRSSIELSRNAKGEYSFVIKAYYEEGAEVEALDRIERIDSTLRLSYIPQPADAKALPDYEHEHAMGRA